MPRVCYGNGAYLEAGWLSQFIVEDEQSGATWRIQRARVMNGVLLPDETSAEVPWPEGAVDSLQMTRDRDAATRMRDAILARHWWQQYWEVESDEIVYAAWEFFLRCVDRRAYIWIASRAKEREASEPQLERRMAHLRINFDQVKQSVKKKEEATAKNFLGRKIIGGIGPWNSV